MHYFSNLICHEIYYFYIFLALLQKLKCVRSGFPKNMDDIL